MSDVRDLYAAVPLLTDPWDPDGPIPLDGSMEHMRHHGSRAAFWRVFQALAVLVFAFVLFQTVSSVVAVVLLMARGVPSEELLREMTQNLGAHIEAVMLGNTAGQVLGLAVPALLLAGLHSSRRAAFLRFRPSDWMLLGLGLLGLVALTPVVQWLGNLNSTLPVPEWIRVLEQTQMQLIEQVLGADTSLLFNLSVLALTPAFCEELLFRGYVQRQAERGLGVTGGILFSGVLFGLYHLRLTQVLPLVVLGVYLAYLVWRTGSLWPAIVVHFANNAFAIFLETYVSARPEMDLPDVERLDIPWYIVAAGAACFAVLMAAMQRTASARLSRAGRRAPGPHASEAEPPIP